jgi:sirohydrochlorin ferrochelatase
VSPLAWPPLLLVAHGTRDEAGTSVVYRLAASARRRLPGVCVQLAFVDVRRPTVADVAPALPAASMGGIPAASADVVVLPMFLAAGYHVRRDLPAQLAAAGLADRAVLTPVLGADPRLVLAAEDRLRAAGWRRGDATVLAAAGSSDPNARAEVAVAARALGRRLGCPVRVGYLAGGEPSVGELVTRAGSSGRRVAVASWLLAPGEFGRRLAGAGADVVAAPLGPHPEVVRAVLARYAAATAHLAAA